MRLGTLTDGRAGMLDGDRVVPLPGRVEDLLCRPPPRRSWPGIPVEEVRLAAPLPRPRKVVGVGLNYADHARETGQSLPERPLLFAKAPTCVVGPGAPIRIPWPGAMVDYEAELAVVIGAPARAVAPDEAVSVIGGYTAFNDVSERKVQADDGQWFRSKSFDTFGPMGPWLVTPDELGDPQNLSIRCLVNGEARQDSNTSLMKFGVAELVSYCSHAFMLEPGDVIATGTPSGVGLKSRTWLAAGDTVTVEIEGIGQLTNVVEAVAPG